MRIASILVAVALCCGLVTTATLPRQTPVALACTGGGYGPLEDLVDRSRYVFVADAIEVGDGINRAPTLVPTATATATPLFAVRTPVSPPAQQPVPRPTSGPRIQLPNRVPVMVVIPNRWGSN